MLALPPLSQLNQWYNGLSEGTKVAYAIIGMNAAVFLMWRVPRLQPTMVRYFSSNPASRSVCLPMLLSTFSHSSLLHLCANMLVLTSFAPAAVALWGKEQFVAMYLSAGETSFVAALKAIVAMDVAGILLKWQLLDHAAHLGGSIFGIAYILYGQEVWKRREVVMKTWHDISFYIRGN
ncbi:hypothetical protein HPB47_014277 [Ixodes persulcatus]|uniref:Uncharacterized protein n=1 Tax=Ixodes persulcatus TaxID=34615 RepID=A0AC60R1G4_IXOPE|nr:hypothetical protein HPB47_014277 [Ixodes persulcatus]